MGKEHRYFKHMTKRLKIIRCDKGSYFIHHKCIKFYNFNFEYKKFYSSLHVTRYYGKYVTNFRSVKT